MEQVIGLNKAQLGIMLILDLNSCFKNSKTRAFFCASNVISQYITFVGTSL